MYSDKWILHSAMGNPFVFGSLICAIFECQQVAQTGHASMPTPDEQVIDGHAVLAVGYNNANNWFVVRNSWEPNRGMKGHFTFLYIPSDTNLPDDFL